MAYVNVHELVIRWLEADSIPVSLKSYPEDFEVRELECGGAGTPVASMATAISASNFRMADVEESLLCAIDSCATPGNGRRTGAPAAASQGMEDHRSDAPDALDAQVQSILGEQCFQEVLKYGQDMEKLLTEDFEMAKTILEAGVLLQAPSLLDKRSRGVLQACFVNVKFPFLDMTIEGQEGQKEEGVSTVAIRGDKKLLSFISNVGLSLPQGITFGRLSKRNSNCLSMTISEAREWTKSKRTTFYQMLSREFPQLQARTVQDETGQVIEVRQKPSKKRKQDSREEAGDAVVPCHLAFTLFKQNLDHNSAVEKIASALSLPPTAVSYAGMKDSRAVASQRMVISLQANVKMAMSRFEKLEACKAEIKRAMHSLGCIERVKAVHPHPSSLCREPTHNKPHNEEAGLAPGITACHFGIAKKPLSLGELGGNYFRLYLRAVPQEHHERLRANLMKGASDGFINFFGSQRFSSSSTERCYFDAASGMPQSPKLGELLLCKKFHDLPGVMLASLATKNEVLYGAAEQGLRESSSSDYDDVLALMPPDSQTGGRASLEKTFLRNLVRYGARKVYRQGEGEKKTGVSISEVEDAMDADNRKAHAMAVKTISHFHRTLWVTSYQSWLWNGAVSHRVALSGSVPMSGDLIMDIDEKGSKAGGEVRLVTKAEIDACDEEQLRNMAFRIVYPLVGTSVRLPSHEEVDGETLYPEEVRAIMDSKSSDDNIAAAASVIGAVKPPKGAYRHLFAKAMHASVSEDESVGPECCEVCFRLPAGSFATSLLAQVACNSKLF